MRQRLSLILTLFAWLLATGSHWDLVQVVAWGRMFVTNAQSMPALAAVKQTFSADARCLICKTVSRAKQQQESAQSQTPGSKAPGEILLLCAPPVRVCLSPAPLRLGLGPDQAALASAEPVAPLLTPPRAVA